MELYGFKYWIGLVVVGAISNVTLADQITFRQGVNGYEHLGAHIRDSQDTQNYGGSTQMLAGHHSSIGLLRPVLAFDLSDIPAGSIINSISLTLTTDTAGSGTVGDLELHRVNGSDTMVEWTGLGASSNFGVTWNRLRAGVLWNNYGGDFEPTSLSVVGGFPASQAGTAKVFDSTTDFVNAAQDAFDNGTVLELIVTSPATSASGSNFVRFASDDHETTSLRPLLTIDYQVPEPTSLALLGAAVPLMLGRHRFFIKN